MAWGVMPGTSSGMCEGMSDLLTRGQHLSGDKYGKQSVNPPISFFFENILNSDFCTLIMIHNLTATSVTLIYCQIYR